MTDERALTIAREWIDAWNSHDIERIMSHYSDAVQLTSPLVSRILGPGQSTVIGKPALRSYFLRSLEAFPDLRFNLWGAYPGQDSVVVHYESVRGLRAAEFMRIDASGRVCEVVAHYATPTPAGM
jgi:hypothetical protein